LEESEARTTECEHQVRALSEQTVALQEELKKSKLEVDWLTNQFDKERMDIKNAGDAAVRELKDRLGISSVLLLIDTLLHFVWEH
jgi:uncharacterized coiled-coil protein SlyX